MERGYTLLATSMSINYYFLLDKDNFVTVRYNTSFNKNIPSEATMVSKETHDYVNYEPDPYIKWHYNQADETVTRTDTMLNRDELNTNQLRAEICANIDKYILSKIKPMPYDYSSVEQAGQWAIHPDTTEFHEEAKKIYDWGIQCQLIGFSILSLGAVCSSADEALALLPPFPFD